jgi:diguanylate cyclase (GGDEF)-like protein
MSHFEIATVCILTTDAARARLWAEAVSQAGMRVGRPDTADAQSAPVEVVLTDRWPAASELQQTERSDPALETAGPPGVVCVGQDGPADVVLPADATGREIGLACRLLAQVVRLRWQLRLRERLQQRLTTEAMTDPLTGLPNRRAWDCTLQEYLAAKNADQPLCMAVLDLDHFKRINDSHGHVVGDRVLQVVGVALRDSLRGGDFVARLGGDEFGLLLPVPSPLVGIGIVDRVRRRLPTALEQAALPVVTASAGCHVLSGSVGAPLPCPDILLDAADQALQQAKRAGRDRTLAWSI